ncbi:hypothetical protein BH11PLA2_BH11PLA2_49890 [soil metagenome]
MANKKNPIGNHYVSPKADKANKVKKAPKKSGNFFTRQAAETLKSAAAEKPKQ